ncbi:hypothetical protein DH86_00001464 [Scytalidium sp. 3C]|nr:hypothetical protein DH86_00001464 [Scytalidium sp. 3C]
MRLPKFSSIIRTIYTLNFRNRPAYPHHIAFEHVTQRRILKSMPTIPFLSHFFSSSSNSSNMSYPVQKSEDEWRANNSESFASKVLRPHLLANMTNTCLKKVYTLVPHVMPPCIRPTKSSSLVVVGLPISTISQVL